jgi:hypothetical protein
MIYRTVRLVNLVLAGMLAGNEFGTWAAVHPSLAKLGQSERIRAEQELLSLEELGLLFIVVCMIASACSLVSGSAVPVVRSGSN